MKQLKSIQVMVMAFGGFFLSEAYANSSKLYSLSDTEMSETTGQALMSLTYISPKDTLNLESQRTGLSNPSSGGVGFYKLGLEGVLELNANIKKLQLGCGGMNGAGACDIDIDYLSLSGISETSTGRASSSAKLTNPFTEIAIRNPNSASTREVLGFRMSSEKAEGLLTFGLENGSAKSGINSLSGYMEVAATSGIAKVNPINGLKPSDVNGQQISGEACGLIICLPFTTTDYTLNLRNSSGSSTAPLLGNLTLPQQVITGKRISVAPLKANATVSGIQVSGNIKAVAAGIINLDKATTGTVNNLKVDVSISEDLGYFHRANLNGTPASLSLQATDILWPGTKSLAQRGWWLEFSNPIDIGDVSPTDAVNIASNTIEATLVQISDYLTNEEKVKCGAAGLLSCLGGSTINIGTPDLSNAPAVPMALTNLVLANQSFAPNCYGTLKFC
ncbi:hypothetical protein MMO39_10730 [Acinetobacter modestus]|uniref:hypothetical protein n=1 Tax=Acinetobacter modestus TaxID=1776740 RepID=UPI001F4A37C9|nr:hypothetical protein [Acinetobacter modestus]MCH7332062.1 hypothetical protein [Acinetobacter modestus]MCH7387772.1 hypothetical protein [Acinetobacter modestus]